MPTIAPLADSITSLLPLGDRRAEVWLTPEVCVMSGYKHKTSGSASSKTQELAYEMSQGQESSIRLFLIACMASTDSSHSKDVCLDKNVL